MNKILVFTDPHQGLRRTANTTPASSLRLRQAIHDQLRDVIALEADFRICAGDWFDTYNNEELVIAQSIPLMADVDIVLAGNHDLINIKDRMGSLGLVKSVLESGSGSNDCKVIMNNVGESNFFVDKVSTGGVSHTFYTVPHCSTQELFDKALDKAFEDVSSLGTSTGEKRYLVLHCNYDSNFANERQTDLNLPKFKAAELFESFDYIILGHEHIPRDDFQGRLVVLGNTHPTSFSDISDKRVMFIDDNGIQFKDIWYKSTGYLEVDWRDLEESYPHQFIKIVGSAKPEDIQDITKAAKVVERNSPNLFALKLDVEFEGITHTSLESTEKAQSMSERIEAVLEKSDKGLLAIWKEFS